jgi:hypothetical protein
MRTSWYPLAALAIALSTAASATTLDEVYGKYIEARGGADKLAALKSLRVTGRAIFGQDGSFQADWAMLVKKPGMMREEITLQGLSTVDACDGKDGWRVDPFQGRRDATPRGRRA